VHREDGWVTIAYLGLGSNVGERQTFCRRALDALRAAPGIEVQATSSLYETSPIGGPPQRSYINAVVRVDTDLNPHGLLKACKAIEQQLGREPSDIKWGPRVVDLDVLTYGDEKLSDPELEIPHSQMTQRRFVLVPLLEIDPEATDPWGTRYADSLDTAEGEVELLEPL
jgi:2-amino-4-hydroxy-6-hydroxymethyldihydropteridine diphosphokinase